jgi:uncharacterized membrane protein YczE
MNNKISFIPHSFLEWLSVEAIYFDTLMAVFVLLISIACFQVVTRMETTLGSSDSLPSNEESSVPSLGNVFAFSASPRRIVAGCVGPLLLGFGSGISVSAGFGTFGITVLLDGIYQAYAIPFWVSQLLLTLGCYLVAWKWAKIPLGMGTLPALILIGPAISLGAVIAPENLSFLGNLAAFFFGTLVFAFGISLIAAAALGPDGKTALSLATEKKYGWSISRSTFFYNASSILIGATLGGYFGVATLLNLIAVPILLHYFIPQLRRYLSN